ncbi:MAG TPA: flagellin [Phycisphaerae bacterium]|jgi:flagellin
MSRINTNVPAVIAQRHLSTSQSALAASLERLSSGLRINRGADDPAGLIVSERLRSEISAVGQAIDNSQRAINVISTTEGALDEVSRLLTDIQALVVEAANRGAISDDEVAANQLQIDSAIDSIARIANTTTFAGRKLLDGSLDYVTSGVNSSQLADVQVLRANFGTRDFVPVDLVVSQSAQHATLGFPATGLSANGGVSVDIFGPQGIITLSFPGSATAVAIANSINAETDATGVQAVASGNPPGSAGVRIESLAYGSNAFVQVHALNGGQFAVYDENGNVVERDEGRDAAGTINGAATVGDGLKLSLHSRLLDVEIILDQGFGTGSSSFAITSGGSLFQLGPQVNSNLQENIGVRAVHPNKLGNAIIGFLSDLQSGQAYDLRSGKFKEASETIDEVITQVAVLRGRLGAFERNSLQTNISALQITMENLTSSESLIRDTDFAQQTSELTRSQILVQAGTSILTIANAQNQNVLRLLGG